MSDPAAPILDDALRQFLTGGLSLNAGGGGADGASSQCRALGCRIDGDPPAVTLWFARRQAESLLDHVARSGALAVVFSDPPTHQTLQLKGRDARVVLPAAADRVRVEAYRDAFVARLKPLGFTEPMLRALLACPDEELVAVRFTPEALFNQTPGASPCAPLSGGGA